MGILARQFEAGGWLGVIGFLGAFVGIGFTLMEGRDHIFDVPILRLAGLQTANPEDLAGLWELILNATVFSLGHLVLGVAMFRARVLPRPAAVLVAASAPIVAFSPPIGIREIAIVGYSLYSVGMFWVGCALAAAPKPTR